MKSDLLSRIVWISGSVLIISLTLAGIIGLIRGESSGGLVCEDIRVEVGHWKNTCDEPYNR